MALISLHNEDGGDPVARVREAARAAITADRLSQKQAASACGVPEGTFGPWLANKYPGDSARVAAQVQVWLDAREERRAMRAAPARDPGFVLTRTAERILYALDHAQHVPDIAAIAAVPGTGKTRACEEQRRRRPNVVLATMRPSSSSVPATLAAVLEAAGEPEAKGTPQALRRRLLERLSRGSDTLVIVDEAQHLSLKAADELRSLHDGAGIGLALVGDQHLMTIFQSAAQLVSRVGMRHKQAKALVEDVDTLAAAWGVEGREALAFCREIARRSGALRQMVKTIKLADRLAAAQEQPRGVEHLRAAYGQLAPEALS